MAPLYTLESDMLSAPHPEKGILSRTLHGDERVKVVFFQFAAGEELSEHTASVPAILHFVDGRAELTLGGDAVEAGPGTWIHMTANLKHSVRAVTPVTLVLTMLKGGA